MVLGEFEGSSDFLAVSILLVLLLYIYNASQSQCPLCIIKQLPQAASNSQIKRKMTEDSYFGNIRTVGASIDQGIAKLQETWKMPHLFFCKNNEEDQSSARKLIENLRNELNILKQQVEESKVTVSSIRQGHTQFLAETGEAIKNLKEQVNDMKILFIENGYEADVTASDVSSLNDQLELLSVSNSFTNNCDNTPDSFACSNSSVSNALNTDSMNEMNPSIDNISLNGIHKRSLLNERPMEPMYSPYFYKMMKK